MAIDKAVFATLVSDTIDGSKGKRPPGESVVDRLLAEVVRPFAIALHAEIDGGFKAGDRLTLRITRGDLAEGDNRSQAQREIDDASDIAQGRLRAAG